MDIQSIIIAVLLGVVTNIITFFITRNYTTSRERESFREEEKMVRSRTADAAVGHLRSSYLAVKKLELSVRSQQRQIEDSSFRLIVWGISQSLEQIRLGLQGHMNVWKSDLSQESDTYKDVIKFITDDIILLPSSTSDNTLDLSKSSQHTSSAPAISKESYSPLPSSVPNELPGARSIQRLMQGGVRGERRKMMEALIKGDPVGLKESLISAIERDADIDEIVVTAVPLSTSGDQDARDYLIDILTNRYEEIKSTAAKRISITAIIQYYYRQDLESEGLDICESIANRFLSDDDINNEDKAAIFSQLGLLFHGAKDFEKALQFENRAIELEPGNAVYTSNIAISYMSIGDIPKAREMHEKSLKLNIDNQSGPIDAAVGFFVEIDDIDRANDLIDQLASIDPIRAEMRRMLLAANKMGLGPSNQHGTKR